MRPEDLKRPYAGSTPLFKIGLFPFEPAEWIEVDQNLGRYLTEKDRLLAEYREKVFVAEPHTRKAQSEVLDQVVGHLLQHFPDVYQRLGDTVSIPSLGRSVDLADERMPDLVKAAMLVQDDLVLMRRNDEGWRLVAGCVCFPSSWDLEEKFGKPLQLIHEPIPEFGPGTRNAGIIERIFDNLNVGSPVMRLNWSIYPDDRLFQNLRSEVHRKREKEGLSVDNGFVRMETQTLTKLPQTGDVLFNIRIHIEAMRDFYNLADRARICGGFSDLLELLDSEQLAYKGLTNLRDSLAAQLRDIAASEGKSAS